MPRPVRLDLSSELAELGAIRARLDDIETAPPEERIPLERLRRILREMRTAIVELRTRLKSDEEALVDHERRLRALEKPTAASATTTAGS